MHAQNVMSQPICKWLCECEWIWCARHRFEFLNLHNAATFRRIVFVLINFSCFMVFFSSSLLLLVRTDSLIRQRNSINVHVFRFFCQYWCGIHKLKYARSNVCMKMYCIRANYVMKSEKIALISIEDAQKTNIRIYGYSVSKQKSFSFLHFDAFLFTFTYLIPNECHM